MCNSMDVTSPRTDPWTSQALLHLSQDAVSFRRGFLEGGENNLKKAVNIFCHETVKPERRQTLRSHPASEVRPGAAAGGNE